MRGNKVRKKALAKYKECVKVDKNLSRVKMFDTERKKGEREVGEREKGGEGGKK